MYDRELEAKVEAKARLEQRPEGHQKQTPATPPQRAGQSLLRLQRQYGNRYVQRVLMLARKAESGAQLAPEVEDSIHRSRGGGQALDEKVRDQMESAIGADFSGVRVHSDPQADSLSRSVNARAFTVGQDVYFRQGAYEPGSSRGRELLAHELTHVVQQSGGGLQRKLTVSQPGDRHEQEADQVAQAVVRHEQRTASEYAAPPVQRQAEEEKKDEAVQAKAEDGLAQRQAEEEQKDEGM
jgi:Domain of unknown function (DUF4157)